MQVLASIVTFRQATATSIPISINSQPQLCNSLKPVRLDILAWLSSKLRLLKASYPKLLSLSTSCNSNEEPKTYSRKTSWSSRDLPLLIRRNSPTKAVWKKKQNFWLTKSKSVKKPKRPPHNLLCSGPNPKHSKVFPATGTRPSKCATPKRCE